MCYQVYNTSKSTDAALIACCIAAAADTYSAANIAQQFCTADLQHYANFWCYLSTAEWEFGDNLCYCGCKTGKCTCGLFA